MDLSTTQTDWNLFLELNGDEEFYEDDAESLASLETDDGHYHPPEKILGQFSSKIRTHDIKGQIYLVKWQDCSILRSSWEDVASIKAKFPLIVDIWDIEKQKQWEGKEPFFDLDEFHKAGEEERRIQRSRRILRRIKRRYQRVLDIVSV
jgi:hypothetical protein